MLLVKGFVITNTHTPKTRNIEVTKVWNDSNDHDKKRLESIEVQLYKNGEEEQDPVILNAGNSWKHTLEGLYEKENQGKEITYTVKEIGLP